MTIRLRFLEQNYSAEYVHYVFIVWPYVDNLFQFGAMINR